MIKPYTFLCVGASALVFAQTNAPPSIRISYPTEGSSFTTFTFKIKADAIDMDGQISKVRFFADGRLIGNVTNSPFNILWSVEGHDTAAELVLTAEAEDNTGASSMSVPVHIYFSPTAPPSPEVLIVSPENDELFAIGEEIGFSAEVTSSALSESGPVEFFVDGISIGNKSQSNGLNATNPPMSMILRDLSEAYHLFTVRYLGSNGALCHCNWITNRIRIVKLGIANPMIGDGRMTFDVVSAITNQPTSIESSINRLQWQVLTNFPPGAYRFIFSEHLDSSANTRWYRASAPSQ
jgi:hypothetical protein